MRKTVEILWQEEINEIAAQIADEVEPQLNLSEEGWDKVYESATRALDDYSKGYKNYN